MAHFTNTIFNAIKARLVLLMLLCTRHEDTACIEDALRYPWQAHAQLITATHLHSAQPCCSHTSMPRSGSLSCAH